jgi:hypothetical protein
MPRFEQIDVFTDKLLLGTRWRSCTMPMPSTKIRCLRCALDEPFGDDVAYANAQGLCDSDHGLSREGTVMYERRRGERNATTSRRTRTRPTTHCWMRTHG